MTVNWVMNVTMGSLTNRDGEAKDNVDLKKNKLNIYECRDNLKSCSLFVTVKLSSLIWNTALNSKYKFKS